MPQVTRLVTVADLGDSAGDRRIAVSARVEAVLDDGRRLVLLDGRGWSAELRGAGASEVDDIWTSATEAEIVRTADFVVGPDEPFGGRSQDDTERDHWNALAETLREQGVPMDGAELRRLPHDVELSDLLRARLAGSPD
jgi:hypothetical protein